jgi:predicted RNA-binding protein (TIGR00451 family)
VQFLENDLERIRSVADYQFGRGVGKALFPKQVKIIRSRRTGRIRYVHLDDKRLVTMRPTDGLFSLSIAGAMRIAERSFNCLVMVKNSVSEFVASGSDVFAVHVAEADDEIRAKDEVIVIDESREVLAVGRALLSGEEMKAFKRGVAVKTRRGTRKVKYNSI